ncbi:hypothetical protein OXB_2871 [Bacillus sp. OxB-1]|uniref:DUF1642 domain-containing protein n=1 Tax=Bacillus sp. (strain OxB-1) TaxID=98228 RepID=UPI0005820B2C|nr:DUF1642 domain-containing protein [Bacillus sp. OxB-1]BAQ11342.1 hypothetical protein OXB_2871 [Bacillus sp. OxB-1]
MTEKVKLPKQVAEVIEKLRNAEYSDYGIVKYTEVGGPIHIKQGAEIQRTLCDWIYKNNGRNADLLLDALRTGYEVEEKFKAGDWVVVEDCPCERIVGKVQRIKDISKYSTCTRFEYEDWWSDEHKTKLRHATPEEIKAEQERRVWAKIGREPGEFREGDIGILLGRESSYSLWKNLKNLYEEGELKGFHPAESFIEFGGAVDA